MKTTTPPVVELCQVHNLACEVFDAVYDGSESFEEDNIGADLAYLMYAILHGDHCVPELGCEWSKYRPIILLLRKAFPSRKHKVWKHIKIGK